MSFVDKVTRNLPNVLLTNRRKLCYSFCKIFARNVSTVRSVTDNRGDLKQNYDVIVIGAGHNGLVSAAYLQKAGRNVCVLERRHVIGGAAVTEEIIPGFKFSRASYVLSLLRPQIFKDLQLMKYGLNVYLREPSSYTPLIKPGGINGKATSLTMWRNKGETTRQIAQFSEKDAKRFFEYEAQLEEIVEALEPLLDNPPIHLPHFVGTSIWERLSKLETFAPLVQSMWGMGKNVESFYELMTAPTSKILDKWFESEPLKATLATDSVIGAMTSPRTPGSGVLRGLKLLGKTTPTTYLSDTSPDLPETSARYVLLHHVMGELEGIKGAWGYVQGGMGAVSQAIANCALDHGASIFTDAPVDEILTRGDEVEGVVLQDGTEIHAKVILSNATPKVTYLDLLPEHNLPADLVNELQNYDYTSPVTKINVAVKEIPNFVANPNMAHNKVMPHHHGTIHLNCEDSDLIHQAFLEAQNGRYSRKPVIEMVIPSSLDPTLAPPGCHVCLLFTQYTPYKLADGKEWDDQTRNEYADTVFDCIEQYAPGFKASVIGRDILTPPDLEKIFGLTGGNIFHGSMSMDQLYLARPVSQLSNYNSPFKGLYLCGSGAHPGGGVMGSPGRLAAKTVIANQKLQAAKEKNKTKAISAK